MEVSLNWIKKYVDLDHLESDARKQFTAKENVDVISKALTSLGFEVEGIRMQGSGITNVVVAEVLECERHPEADKLSVCKVSDGTEIFPVVCGAPNVAKGQKVLLARVGASLPSGEVGKPNFVIKKAKLRGQDSHGMICAEDELGLGESHAGILVLDAALPLGLPFDQISGLCDTVFEINVTPNRPDALCHIGVARELAAKFGKPLRYPTHSAKIAGTTQLDSTTTKNGKSKNISIALEDKIGCTKYTGRIIEGVKVGPSPEWLVKALKSLGKRSINNVVDLTNYVLLELGQPSHAFDLDKIAGEKIIIRRAEANEKLLTLDDVERKLTPEDLVIADGNGPMVLAGVMGGKTSEVDVNTKNIFLEVAYFDPSTVRRQGRRHGLSSDSSYRFERGVDPLNTEFVSDYLAGLIAENCGGNVVGETLVVESEKHPVSRRVVSLRPTRASKLLGIPVSSELAIQRLESIDLKIQNGITNKNGATANDDSTTKNGLTVNNSATLIHGEPALNFAIPGFRGDLEREADLIEEIARLGDYNSIPAILPSLPLGYKALPPTESLSKTLRHFLRDAGLNETLNLRFSSRKALSKLGLSEKDPRQNFVPLKNPISEEWENLPSTTLPNLLQAVAYNQKNQEKDCRFFEIAKAFYHKPEERSEKLPGIWEEEILYLVLSGEWQDRRPWSLDADKATSPAPIEFYHMKGLLENLLKRVGVQAKLTYPGNELYLHPAESGILTVNLNQAPSGAEVLQGWKRNAGNQNSARIGSFGVLHPLVLSNFDLKGPVLVAEISLSGLLAAEKTSQKFTAFGHFSAVSRDLNLVVDEAYPHESILAKIPRAKIANLQDVRLNSVYRGPGVPEGKKALHYSFVYRNVEKTLTDDEVNKAQEKLSQELAKDTEIIFK